MPNRILREGLLDSESLSKAGEAAEILFVRLMLIVDDFGRFDGRLTVICRRAWPNGGPSELDVLERITKLTQFGLVVAYEVEDKPFIYIPKFKQRTRSSKSKFPDPPQVNPQAVSHMSDERPTTDGHVTAVGARISSFVVRNSYSGEAVDKSTSTHIPRPAAQSLARTEANHELLEQAAATAAPMPDQLRKVIKRRPIPPIEDPST